MGPVGSIKRALIICLVCGGVLLGTAAWSAAGDVSPRTGPLTAHAAACVPAVQFGLIEATTTGCLLMVSSNQWESTDTVNLNGIPLLATGGTKLTLTGPTSAAPGGNVTLRLQNPVVEAGVTWIPNDLINWNLPAGARGEEKTVATTGVLSAQKLFGFDISGSATVAIGWDATNDVRYFKFFANVALPSVFKNGPGQTAGGLTATVGLRVDSAGVHADAVKATVDNAYIGQLQVKNLCLSYVAGGNSTTAPCMPPHTHMLAHCASAPTGVSRWDGTVEVVLPTADRPTLGVYAGLQDGMFSYAGGSVTNLGNSLPIAQGWPWDSCATRPTTRSTSASRRTSTSAWQA
ncbi:MAG: hypothetical protein LC720_08545 [Actinobacteria bacterium]|nr:hypothetical protein [Actinomycetota bacterium]